MHAVAKAMHVLYERDREHAGPSLTEPDIETIKCWLNGTEEVPEQISQEEDGSDTIAFEAETPPDAALCPRPRRGNRRYYTNGRQSACY